MMQALDFRADKALRLHLRLFDEKAAAKGHFMSLQKKQQEPTPSPLVRLSL
jgi:hypothetical protein